MSESQKAGRVSVIAERIREFILEQFPLARRRPLSDDDSLLESGIVDSLGILEIVNFVTEQFGVEITDEDLQPENFDSITSLTEFIETRQGTES